MASILERSPYNNNNDTSKKRDQEGANLREWVLKSQITNSFSENYNNRSRRFSGSYIRNHREDIRSSFRSNITISSTASSPGYTLQEDQFDPSTYSFTTALKALRVRAGYNSSWECLSPEGFALNSKWNEAEKYICNPHSGEVPMECLSSKTLNAKSFRSLTHNRNYTLSTPLVYPSYSRHQHPHSKPNATSQDNSSHASIRENKTEGTTRDIGIQSTLQDIDPSPPISPTSTPSIKEVKFKRCEAEHTADSANSLAAKMKVEDKVMVKETREKEKTTKHDKGGVGGETKEQKDNINTEEQIWRCSSSKNQSGCLPWIRKKHTQKHKPIKKKPTLFLLKLEAC